MSRVLGLTHCKFLIDYRAVTITVDGEDEPNSLDYLFHFISMPWKVICAIIPPKSFLGAYPTFVCSIMWIAGMSAIIEQVNRTDTRS